jgi:hypothetical protein
LFPKFRFLGLVRVSLGIENSEEDIDKLIRVLGKIASPKHISTERNSVSGNKGNPIINQDEVQKQMNDFAKNIATSVYSQQ